MRKQYDDDDGRTIVDMNVEGMPWYDSRIKKEKRKNERAVLQVQRNLRAVGNE